MYAFEVFLPRLVYNTHANRSEICFRLCYYLSKPICLMVVSQVEPVLKQNNINIYKPCYNLHFTSTDGGQHKKP